MARIQANLNTGGTAVALSAATAKTVLQLIAPSNHRVALKGFGISFEGVAPTDDPVLVELVTQTTAGTVTSATPVADHPIGETIQSTGGKNATAEPTTTDVRRVFVVHPQAGYERAFGPDEEIVLAGGGRLGLRVTAPDAVDCHAFMTFEE